MRVVGTKLEAKEQAFKERLSDESFAAYLAREPEPVPTTPMPDASAAPGKVPPPERPDAKLEQYSRDINARAWLAPDFPLSAQQVSAVMDVLQPINKNFERVKEVADLWAQREEGAKFPVRIKVPIFFSIYAWFTVTKFLLIETAEDAFAVPHHYRQMSLEEAMESMLMEDHIEGYDVDGQTESEAPSHEGTL